jgi:hypothetical protein
VKGALAGHPCRPGEAAGVAGQAAPSERLRNPGNTRDEKWLSGVVCHTCQYANPALKSAAGTAASFWQQAAYLWATPVRQTAGVVAL